MSEILSMMATYNHANLALIIIASLIKSAPPAGDAIFVTNQNVKMFP